MSDPVRDLSRFVERPMDERAVQKQWLAIKGRREKARPAWGWAFVGAAVAGAALLAAVGVVGEIGGGGEEASVELASGVVLEASGDDVDLRLPDGSEVALEDGARLVTERAEREEVRFALRRGRATFDVARDPARTFRVVAGEVDVRVVGTRFEVVRDEASVSVRVERGEVEVRAAGETRRLHPGESWRISEAPEVLADEPEAETAEPSIDAPRGTRGPSARELFEDARGARREGRERDAADLYAELLRRHPRDDRAGLAALELARIRMDVLDDPAGAIAPLRRAASSAPGESLREDAMARLVEAYDATGQRARCRSARERYLDRFPEGVHSAGVVRRCAE